MWGYTPNKSSKMQYNKCYFIVNGFVVSDISLLDEEGICLVGAPTKSSTKEVITPKETNFGCFVIFKSKHIPSYILTANAVNFK